MGNTKLSKLIYSTSKRLHMNPNNLFRLSIFFLLFISCLSFSDRRTYNATLLNGTWQLQGSDDQEIAMFSDGYVMITSYNKQNKKISQTFGGTYTLNNNELTILQEFNSTDKEQVGQSETISVKIQGDVTTVETGGYTQTWK